MPCPCWQLLLIARTSFEGRVDQNRGSCKLRRPVTPIESSCSSSHKCRGGETTWGTASSLPISISSQPPSPISSSCAIHMSQQWAHLRVSQHTPQSIPARAPKIKVIIEGSFCLRSGVGEVAGVRRIWRLSSISLTKLSHALKSKKETQTPPPPQKHSLFLTPIQWTRNRIFNISSALHLFAPVLWAQSVTLLNKIC